VTFYAEDVYRVWNKTVNQTTDSLRKDINIRLDDSTAATTNGSELVHPTADPEGEPPSKKPRITTGIHAHDVTYNYLKSHISKSKTLLENVEWLQCTVCSSGLPSGGAYTLTCPHEGCSSMMHLDCLSASWLSQRKDGGEEILVPTSGTCPGCKGKLEWVDLVRELSLRMRGDKETKALFAKERRRKGKDAVEEVIAAFEDEGEEVALEESDLEEDLEAETMPDAMQASVAEDGNEGWHQISDFDSASASEDDDLPSFRHFTNIRSDPSPPSKRPGTPTHGSRPAAAATTSYSEPVVIQDSDDMDDAEILS
jgi:structure-specific endonuclease subunit SLX1